MEVQLGMEKQRGTVQFQLKVWDSGLRPRFQMVTSGEQEIFTHNSGLLEAVQGSLEIRFAKKQGMEAHALGTLKALPPDAALFYLASVISLAFSWATCSGVKPMPRMLVASLKWT